VSSAPAPERVAMLPIRSPHVPVLMVLIAMFVAAPASASPLYTIDSVAMATNTTLLVAVSPGDSQQKAPTPPQSEAPQNVQINVTVRSGEGEKSQVIYQVTGVFGDGGFQQLNTGRDMFVELPGAQAGGNYRPTGLSLNAQPTIIGRSILLAFKVDFTLPVSRQPGDKNEPPKVQQEATTILESGKPLTVFTSDSPGQTPKISVELTATILTRSSQP
jgi:hypothetical protein